MHKLPWHPLDVTELLHLQWYLQSMVNIQSHNSHIQIDQQGRLSCDALKLKYIARWISVKKFSLHFYGHFNELNILIINKYILKHFRGTNPIPLVNLDNVNFRLSNFV